MTIAYFSASPAGPHDAVNNIGILMLHYAIYPMQL